MIPAVDILLNTLRTRIRRTESEVRGKEDKSRKMISMLANMC